MKRPYSQFIQVTACMILISILSFQKLNAQVTSAAQSTLTKANIEAALNEAYNKFKDLKEGKNADYIKELATVDPNIFGIVLVTVDGQIYTAGDVK